jgi:SAM-dependent methyltransferase
MQQALAGELELRDRFYFINRAANARFEELLEGLTGKRVVVVGSSDCGVTPLARRGVYVEGTDISPVSIEKLQRSIDKEGLGKFASARVMDAEDLDYAPASLDVIACSGVLHHIDTEKSLQSWARCLKPDGAAVLFEPLAFHPFVALFRLLTPAMRTPDEHPLREKDFRLMKKYFREIERSDFGLFTPMCAAIALVPGLRSGASRLLPVLERVDAAMLRLFPFLRNHCWLTVVRLRGPFH